MPKEFARGKMAGVNTNMKRKTILTGEPVQLRYLALVVLSMVVPLVIFGGALYFLIFNIMAEQIGIPEHIAVNVLPAIQKINMIILVGFPPLVLLLFFWGLILSHRFAGPLRRIEKELDEIAESGDFKKRIKVRQHDDIRKVANSINKLLATAERGKR